MEMTVSAHLLKITADCRACNNLVKEIQSKAPGPEETGKTGDTHTQKKTTTESQRQPGGYQDLDSHSFKNLGFPFSKFNTSARVC